MPSTKHIIAFGRILFVLLVVANSGFTMILHTCLMPDMSCCEPSEWNVTGTDGYDPNRTIACTPMPSVCCQLDVVGGTDSRPVSTDRSNDSRVQKLSLIGTIPHSSIAPYTAFSLPSTAFPLLSERAGPYPVATYILNASFLI